MMMMMMESFSADGNYEVTLMTKATVYFDGRVIWEVSDRRDTRWNAFFRLATGHLQVKLYDQCGILSIRWVHRPGLKTCTLDCVLEDIQHCQMKFGSWTYSGEQVDLVHINQTNGSTPVYGNNSEYDSSRETMQVHTGLFRCSLRHWSDGFLSVGRMGYHAGPSAKECS